MQKVTPYLWFDKNAEEAMNFYVSVFKGSPSGEGKNSKIVSLARWEGNLDAPGAQEMQGKVLRGVFQLAGQEFFAFDGGPMFKFTEALSLFVDCKDQAEIDYFWDKLSEGGDENAQNCGWLKDKFGLSWQIFSEALDRLMTDPDPAKANRVTQAMLQMKKIDIKALEKAYSGE